MKALTFFSMLFLSTNSLAISFCIGPPTGNRGHVRYFSNQMQYCSSGTWVTFSIASTLGACATNGMISISGTAPVFCENGSANIPTYNGTDGTCTTVGILEYRNFLLEWCDGTNWQILSF